MTFVLRLSWQKSEDPISKCFSYVKESVNYFEAVQQSRIKWLRSAADSSLPPPAFSLRYFHKQHGLSGLIAAALGQISQSYYYPM